MILPFSAALAVACCVISCVVWVIICSMATLNSSSSASSSLLAIYSRLRPLIASKVVAMASKSSVATIFSVRRLTRRGAEFLVVYCTVASFASIMLSSSFSCSSIWSGPFISASRVMLFGSTPSSIDSCYPSSSSSTIVSLGSSSRSTSKLFRNSSVGRFFMMMSTYSSSCKLIYKLLRTGIVASELTAASKSSNIIFVKFRLVTDCQQERSSGNAVKWLLLRLRSSKYGNWPIASLMVSKSSISLR